MKSVFPPKQIATIEKKILLIIFIIMILIFVSEINCIGLGEKILLSGMKSNRSRMKSKIFIPRDENFTFHPAETFFIPLMIIFTQK